MRKSYRRWLVREVLRLKGENHMLRTGLRQVAEGDYPADAGNPETWAQEVLDRPESVDWEAAPNEEEG